MPIRSWYRRWPALLSLIAALLVAAPAFGAGGLGNLFGGSSEQSQPLPPEQAYPFSVDIASPQEIVARWDSRDGYYLYRDKFSFELIGSDAQIKDIQLPKGEDKDDPYFGTLAVLYGPTEVRLSLDRPLAGDATLRAGYQGCADAGLCYPPQTIDYPLTRTTATAAPAATVAPMGGDRLSQLLTGGDTLLMFGGFFAAGLLLAFTAYLYPMIPILSGLIAGDRQRRSTGRAFLLSLVYVEATAVTYAAAGALAGLTGLAVQADLQSPWVLGSFAGLFVLLALSMFGLFELQLPSRWQTRLSELAGKQRGGSFIGVAIMGMLSALIVGACSGPALIAALVFISNTGDAWLGGLALFVLANGMGLPLLLIGTAAGRWLPRSGPWMVGVRRLFGVGFLIVALWLVERLLPGHIALALWGALLLGCAVYLGAFDQLTVEAGGVQRLRKFGGVLLLLWGGLLLLGAAAGSQNFWRPLESFGARGGSAPMATEFLPGGTVAGLEQQLQRAKKALAPALAP
jgi:thiol:disulfide interchange protein DsbD